jgi:hypothetical protein
VALGLLAGVVTGVTTWVNNIASILLPDSFVTYANDTASVAAVKTDSDVVISITIPELNQTRMVRGLLRDEWHKLARGVVSHGYRYTTRDLQDIFGPQEGNRIYGRVTQQLMDAGVLVPAGSNGVAVTDHIGKNFFDQLDKRDYKILNLIPSPTGELA